MSVNMTPDTYTTPAADLVKSFAASIKGKTIITTGVSPGTIGAFFVAAVATGNPKLLILAGRSQAKLDAVAADLAQSHPNVATRTLSLDLSSLAAVRGAAETVLSWTDVPAIDLLMNNAGIMAVPYALTVDGIESQFATNHLGPWLFSNLLLPKIRAANGSRIVFVSSAGHRFSAIRWADVNFDGGNTYNKWVSYGQSKTANVLSALWMGERLAGSGVSVASVHPGVVMTHLADHLDWEKDFADISVLDRRLGHRDGWRKIGDAGLEFKDASTGASSHVYAAFAPELKDLKGPYIADCQVVDPRTSDELSAHARDLVEAEKLWALSEKMTGVKFDL